MTPTAEVTSSECGFGGAMDDEYRWFERLPVGSWVSIEALQEFKWPIDPIDSSGWLRVGCVQSFGPEEILEWMRALPREGVIVDFRVMNLPTGSLPDGRFRAEADPRLEKLLRKMSQRRAMTADVPPL